MALYQILKENFKGYEYLGHIESTSKKDALKKYLKLMEKEKKYPKYTDFILVLARDLETPKLSRNEIDNLPKPKAPAKKKVVRKKVVAKKK